MERAVSLAVNTGGMEDGSAELSAGLIWVGKQSLAWPIN